MWSMGQCTPTPQKARGNLAPTGNWRAAEGGAERVEMGCVAIEERAGARGGAVTPCWKACRQIRFEVDSLILNEATSPLCASTGGAARLRGGAYGCHGGCVRLRLARVEPCDGPGPWARCTYPRPPECRSKKRQPPVREASTARYKKIQPGARQGVYLIL